MKVEITCAPATLGESAMAETLVQMVSDFLTGKGGSVLPVEHRHEISRQPHAELARSWYDRGLEIRLLGHIDVHGARVPVVREVTEGD